MSTPAPCLGAWRGSVARLVCAGAAVISLTVSLAAADALFPRPLHITRRVEDPVADKTTTIHEYCAGDQIIAVSGDRVTITDHARREVTEIDRAAGTYSITTFDALAAAHASTPRASAKGAAQSRWSAAPLGRANGFAIAFAAGEEKLEVELDPNVRLSKAALEALIGASYPSTRTAMHDAILDASGRVKGKGDRRIAANALPDADYALPVEQTITADAGGESVTIRSKVVEVRSELAPPGIATIPPGSRLVESTAIRLARELREADQLPDLPRE